MYMPPAGRFLVISSVSFSHDGAYIRGGDYFCFLCNGIFNCQLDLTSDVGGVMQVVGVFGVK